MSTRIRHLGLILLVQAGCLGIGLWMHRQFVVSSLREVVEDQTWAQMGSVAHELRVAAETLTTTSGLALNEDVEFKARLSAVGRRGFADVSVLDSRWHLVWPFGAVPDTPSPAEHPAPVIKWTPRTPSPLETTPYKRGRATLPDGPHVAIMVELPAGRGYALVHRPVASLEDQVAALARPLSALSVMTFLWVCASLSIVAYIVLSRLYDQIAIERSRSASDALQKTQSLLRTRDAVIFGLAKLAESRDPETGDHLERISVYSTCLASALRRHPAFRDQVTPAFVRLIGISSALHDIGKVGVEDRILRKRGPLTRDERMAMQTHTTIGGNCLREIEQRLGGSNFLQMAREIAFSHHENWDGNGYPDRLAGTAIPLSARIVAIADVYDALVSRRVYKEPLPHEECVDIMRRDAGKKFDPNVLNVWMSMESRFRSVAGRYSAGGAASPTDLSSELSSRTEPSSKEDKALCSDPVGGAR